MPSILRFVDSARLVSMLTVRARIVVIALIPVVGFLANGDRLHVAASTKSTPRSTASNARRRSPTPAANSRARSAPSSPRARAFARASARELSAVRLDERAGCGDRAVRHASGSSAGQAGQADLAAIERILPGCRRISATWRRNTNGSAPTNATGIRAKLREAAPAVERVIDLDMSWLADRTAHRLVASLLSMRRFEAAFMLDRDVDDRQGFRCRGREFQQDH